MLDGGTDTSTRAASFKGTRGVCFSRGFPSSPLSYSTSSPTNHRDPSLTLSGTYTSYDGSSPGIAKTSSPDANLLLLSIPSLSVKSLPIVPSVSSPWAGYEAALCDIVRNTYCAPMLCLIYIWTTFCNPTLLKFLNLFEIPCVSFHSSHGFVFNAVNTLICECYISHNRPHIPRILSFFCTLTFCFVLALYLSHPPPV